MKISGNRIYDGKMQVGVISEFPTLTRKITIESLQQSYYGIQCSDAQIGRYIAISGSMNPSGIAFGVTQEETFEIWTSKQGYYHSYEYVSGEWKDRVVDSAIYLIKINSAGTVTDHVNLEPVIYGIVKNIQERADTNERNPAAPLWINPFYLDRCKRWDAYITSASPDYMDIPESDSVSVVTYVSGDRNVASSYLRPSQYAGVLGPVYAGTMAVSDVTTKRPWMSMSGPADPSNIAVRDIKEDSYGNLWCLLQIGWQYADVYPNKVNNSSYPGYECRIGMQYDDTYTYGSTSLPTSYPAYDPAYFPRQYVPPHSGTSTEINDRYYRCGLPRARMFLVCFNKSTDLKTWDYLPFIPGTHGFRGKYYVDSNPRGPCVQTIASPPLKLDIDSYGNVYAVCGTWFGYDTYNSYPSAHWEGTSYAFNEYMYFYQRLDSEMSSGYTPLASGIDVGRIGPYTSGGTCTLWRYDLDTSAYKGKGSAGTNNIARWKSAWTYTIGGDRATITKYRKVAPYEYYWFSAMGNRTLSKCIIRIDTTAARPHPVFTGSTSLTSIQMPHNIRSWNSEWYSASGSNSGRELAMEMDLLFAQCDLFTRNYYGATGSNQPTLSQMTSFDPNRWWEYEEKWRNPSLMKPAQIHLDRTGFFQSGNASGENPTGFNLAESPLVYYPHIFAYGNVYYETEFVGRSGVGTVYTSYGRIPLLKGCNGSDSGWDAILRPASCPYTNPANFYVNPVSSNPVQLTQFFENCSIMGCLPTMKSRIANEDAIITPLYNFKYEMFGFTGITWDSFEELRNRYSQTKYAQMPWRFHSYIRYPTDIYPATLHQIGAKSAYIDSTIYGDGDYIPKTGEKVVRYTTGYFDAVNTVKAAADAGDTGAKQAYDLFVQYLASVKFYIWENTMQDINFGSFGSSHRTKNLCAMITPMPLLHATQYQDETTWHLDLIWDETWGKRLYYITPRATQFDRTWTLQSNASKSWWAVSGSLGSQTASPVIDLSWVDLTNDQVQKLESWVMNPDLAEYCIEKWQQLWFVDGYPDGTRESPQVNLV